MKISKVKDKKRTLKVAREKQKVTYKGKLIRISADFQQQICKPKGVLEYIQNVKVKQNPKYSA